MTESPKNPTAASKLMSQLVGEQRPLSTLPRSVQKLSRESLSRDMIGFYNNCAHLIQNCAKISEALRHPEVQQSPQIAEIRQFAGILNTDLKRFSDRLKEIKADQDRVLQLQDDSEYHMQSLLLGQTYASWTEEFTQVVLPNYETLVGHVNAVINASQNDTQSV